MQHISRQTIVYAVAQGRRPRAHREEKTRQAEKSRKRQERKILRQRLRQRILARTVAAAPARRCRSCV